LSGDFPEKYQDKISIIMAPLTRIQVAQAMKETTVLCFIIKTSEVSKKSLKLAMMAAHKPLEFTSRGDFALRSSCT
jgi:hypothetical protein